MRVGIDYWTACTHAPGVGRYVRELVRALALRDDSPELALLDLGPGPRGVPAEDLGLDPMPRGWSRLTADVPRGVYGLLGALGLSPDRLQPGLELFHAVDQRVARSARVPGVLALSEIPLRTAPRGEPPPAALVVFSEAARVPFAEALGLDVEHVHALPVGCDHWTRACAPRDDLGGPSRVVALGRTDAARGAALLFEACEHLLAGGCELELVWCGRAGDQAEILAGRRSRSRFGSRLSWRADEGEAALARTVAEADVLVHLSEREWTPVTPLEGLAAGAALLASRLPAFEEVLGGSAHWVDGSPREWIANELAGALERVLVTARDPRGRAARRAVAAPFTWDRHAALTSALWRRILAAR